MSTWTQAVKVNSLGKWKTALQMVGLSSLLSVREAERFLGYNPESAPSFPAMIEECYYDSAAIRKHY